MPNSIGQLQSKGKSVGTARMGKLYTFKYMATEDMTPYYDMYPTIIVIGKFAGGFTGVNFNYIDHDRRNILLRKLSKLFTKQKKWDFKAKQIENFIALSQSVYPILFGENYEHLFKMSVRTAC